MSKAHRAVGLEAIILYKLVKAAVEGLLGLGAVYLLARGAEAGAATVAEILIEHFTGGWSLRAATLIVRAATSGHVKFIAVAAFADAGLSAVEGLALRAGRWWAPWLVVAATSLLLPWEIWELLRHPRWGRAVILVVNLAVAAYLLHQAMLDRRNVRSVTPAVDRHPDGP